MPGFAESDDDAGSSSASAASASSASSRHDSAPGDHDATADQDAIPDGDSDGDSHSRGLRLRDPKLRRRGLRRLGAAWRTPCKPLGSLVRFVPAVRRGRELRERHRLPRRARLQPDAEVLRLGIQLRLPFRTLSSSGAAADEHARAVSSSGAD